MVRVSVVLFVAVTACARPGTTVPEPVSEPEPADSASDEAVLEELEALGFEERGAPPALDTARPTPDVESADLYDEAARLFLEDPETGPETRPRYDIDVESFADHERVRYYINYFLGPARDRFEIWLGRLHRYEETIRQVLRAHGVPEDLVYLALIESGYSNTAVSRARAVGMWQFISATGRRYGLHQDAWVDDRRDPFLATDAAARHLSDLNRQFDSWFLAAAAYNAGAGRVSRGLRRLRTSPDAVSDETFFALYDRRYLRRETRDYVPKLLAAALIAKHPERYGFVRVELLQPLTFDEITVTDATGLDVLAELADT